MEIIDIIERLNFELEDKGETYHRFNYRSYGHYNYVFFEDELLWDSDNDEREYKGTSTTKEDLEMYIKKQFNKYVNELNKLKFKIK